MKPKILLLMDNDFARLVEVLAIETTTYSVHRYNGRLRKEDIADYLNNPHQPFDAVAVVDDIRHQDLREAVEETYQGPRILFYPPSDLTKNTEQPAEEANYVIVQPMKERPLASKFEEKVQNYFISYNIFILVQ